MASSSNFTRRADTACSAAARQIEALPRKQSVAQIDSELSIVSRLARQLETITPPARDKNNFTAFINETKDQVTDVRTALAAAKRHDTRTVTQYLNATAAAGGASNETAKLLGLAACAKNYKPQRT
jgi:hypothetical protein